MIGAEVIVMKKLLPICLAAILLVGCQSNSASTASYDTGSNVYSNDMAEAATAAEYSSGAENSAELTTEESEKKIVYTGNLDIQTTDYDASLELIQKDASVGTITIESISEYVDSNNLRYNSLTIRVPSENYQDYMNGASALGNVRSQSSTREDITKQYNDKSITIAALEKEQSRLQEMMDQATSVEDMITIESRLSEVETQLNQYKSDLANLDTDVAMSTIYISLDEVLEYSSGSTVRKESTFLDRLVNTFADSWKFFVNLLEKLLFFIIYLIPLAIVGLIVWFIYRQYRKKHPKAPKPEKPAPQMKVKE